jgi:hypothetical protein
MPLVHAHEISKRERRTDVGVEDEEHSEVGKKRVSDCRKRSAMREAA